MSRFRFVHAADLHLDTPFEGIGRTDPEVQDALRDASLDAWDHLVQRTIACEAAFLLLAGDIYDGVERGVRAQLRFRRGLERLAERGIQTFIVHGNHDPLGPRGGWSAVRAWPALATVFDSAAVQSIAVERGGEPLATVHGISYAEPAMSENLALRFARGSARGLHIGLLHCNVGGDAEHAPYSPCSLDDLRRARLDYWALGHIHRRQVLRSLHPAVVYPGNLQGRGAKSSELGAKGAMVVDVVDERVRRIEFEAVDRVRFLRCTIDVSDLCDLAEVQAAVWRHGEALREQHRDRDLLLCATLVGRGGPRRDLQRSGVRDELLRDLRQQARDLSPFVWWHALHDDARATLEREHLRTRADFSGELVRISDALAADPERRATFAAQCLQALQERSLPPSVSAPTPSEELALLREAEAVALGLLDEAEDS